MKADFAAPTISAVITAALVVLLVGLVFAVRSGNRTPSDFYLAGRRVGAGQNALALFGGFILFTTLFTMTGHIALNGFDAFLFAAAFALSWLIALLLFAAPMRNVGGSTVGDVFAVRAARKPARIASITVTLLLFATYSIVMMEGGGIVAEMMFGVESTAGKSALVAGMGLLATLFVLVGGMAGTTRVLAVKAVLIIGVLAVLAVMVLVEARFNVLGLLDDAQAKAAPHPSGHDLLGPGREFDGPAGSPVVHLSKLFVAFLGHAALPYMFMRNFSVRTGRDARRSVGWAGLLVAGFYLVVAFLAIGAVALIGGRNIGMAPPLRNITLPILADHLGGPVMVGLVGALGALIVVGLLTALLMSAVTSLTRDVAALRGDTADPAAELRAARRNTVILGVAITAVGTILLQAHIHGLLPLTISLAAAAVLPAVAYSLLWKRFNTAGLVWSVFGGTAVTLVLFAFSPLMSGSPIAILQNADFVLIDFDAALLSVPIAFLLGYIGTVSSRERDDAALAELEVRALTGATAPVRPDAPAGAAPADGAERAFRAPSETL